MESFFDIFAIPIGYIFQGLSYVFGNNFALLMLMLTFVVNFCMLPLTIRSQRSTAKQQMLRPKLDALKKKYGENMTQQEKMEFQKEQQELYQKEGVSMTGGCLPMLIRLPFLMAVYSVIREPKNYVGDANLSFDLFGINLGKTPEFSLNFAELTGDQLLLWLIPLFAFSAQMFTSIISLRIQKKLNPDQPNMAGMMLTMPIISLIMGFSFNAAIGLYWGFSSLVGGIIQAVIQVVYSPAKLLARDQAKFIAERLRVEKAKENKA